MGDMSTIRAYDEDDRLMREQIVSSVDLQRLMKLFSECRHFHETTRAAAGDKQLPKIWLRNTSTGELLVYTPHEEQSREIAEKLGIPPEAL